MASEIVSLIIMIKYPHTFIVCIQIAMFAFPNVFFSQLCKQKTDFLWYLHQKIIVITFLHNQRLSNQCACTCTV